MPVPQGFTITTEACTQYYEDGRQINDEIMAEINEYIVKMEGITGKKFGDKENPLSGKLYVLLNAFLFLHLIDKLLEVLLSNLHNNVGVHLNKSSVAVPRGTAVNVQSMAFGNMGDDCGTGVAFTRDPATGEKKLMGEFLTNAQGEDVVAGVRTPMPIAQMAENTILPQAAPGEAPRPLPTGVAALRAA